jgi:hypothetical protein
MALRAMGPTQSRWYAEGYREGMADIARELESGGIEAIREWLRNNLTPQLPP